MRILLFLLAIALFNSCGSGSSETKSEAPAEAGVGDFSGFEVLAIDGTSLTKAVKKDADGNILEEGNILNDQKEGAWISYYNSKRDIGKMKTLTNYHKGVKNGIDLTFAKNGTIETKTSYANNKKHGIASKHKSSRKLEEANFTNGQLDGVFRTFYQSGKLQQESHYKNGKKHGKSIYLNQDEAITMEYEYKDGEQVSGGKVNPPRPANTEE